MPAPEPERILIFLPNWVGDAVMATPVLAALRRHFESARITHLGRPPALATVSGCDWADEVLADCPDQSPLGLSFLRLVGRIRRGGYDLAVLLPNSFRTAAAARMGSVKRIAGYDRDGRGWLLTDKILPPRDQRGKLLPVPAIDYYIQLVEMLGLRCDSRSMSLGVSQADDQDAQDLLARSGVAVTAGERPLIMLNPGASFGPTKMWALLRYAEVADELIRRHGAQIIINAAPAERQIAAQVAHKMQHKPAVNFAEQDNTVGLLKGLMRRCSLLITNDTGARHIAAALGIGVVTLFGSTDPAWTRIDYDLERTIRVDLQCSPCQRKLCSQPPGPMYHQCMTAITPEMVLEAAEELLDILTAKDRSQA